MLSGIDYLEYIFSANSILLNFENTRVLKVSGGVPRLILISLRNIISNPTEVAFVFHSTERRQGIASWSRLFAISVLIFTF